MVTPLNSRTVFPDGYGEFYADYQNGKAGYNTDPARGADTFHPFNGSFSEIVLIFSNSNIGITLANKDGIISTVYNADISGEYMSITNHYNYIVKALKNGTYIVVNPLTGVSEIKAAVGDTLLSVTRTNSGSPYAVMAL